MGTASLAIWNMKKIVIVIATGAWGAGVIFQIQSKPPSTLRRKLRTSF